MRLLTTDAKRTLIQAFVASRLDYCNSLLYGISDGLTRRLQSLQNAAARLITNTSRQEHIASQLHWLPVRHRMTYKIVMLVYKSVRGHAPAYLASYLSPTSTLARRALRSADTATLVIPRTRTKFGDRSFAVSGPVIWNSLPAYLRDSSLTFNTFGSQLETYQFCLT